MNSASTEHLHLFLKVLVLRSSRPLLLKTNKKKALARDFKPGNCYHIYSGPDDILSAVQTIRVAIVSGSRLQDGWGIHLTEPGSSFLDEWCR